MAINLCGSGVCRNAGDSLSGALPIRLSSAAFDPRDLGLV